MSPELEHRLIDRWPTWFDTDGDVQRTSMPFSFEVRDGWFHLIWSLCEDLEPLVAEYEKETSQTFEVLQVKEKFGAFRFYVNGEAQPFGTASRLTTRLFLRKLRNGPESGPKVQEGEAISLNRVLLRPAAGPVEPSRRTPFGPLPAQLPREGS
jgi:hypothetical protein